MSEELSDERLLYLVAQTDKELFEAGEPIARRQMLVLQAVMRRLGYINFVLVGVGVSPIVERINKIFRSIYRKQDIAIGGHIGAFMYRDIFARINIPLIFGQVGFNPFEFVDLTHVQKRMINHEPDQCLIYVDQFNDIMDIQYGVDELNEPYRSCELTARFIGLARLHLHAASAVVTGGYDHRGAVQSSLLATELALKAGIASNGISEDAIRQKYGHNLKKILGDLIDVWPKLDHARVRRVLDRQPAYVLNRYSPDQPDRREVGHTLMGAQYLVAEVVRQMSDRDARACMVEPAARAYPA